MTVTLSIIIVNWNVWDDLHECLNSIYASSFPEEMEVLLVDNASSDRSVVNTQSAFPAVKIISNSINVGFPKANNQALAVATGEFVLYLNPDTVVMPDTLYRCVSYLRSQKDIGLLGCKVLYPDGRIQYECARNFPSLEAMVWEALYFHLLFPKNHHFGKTLMGYWDHQDSRDIPCLIGAFMMGRRSLLQNLGGLDETVFMFFEDIDLCYRVKKGGWRIYYLSDVQIVHKSGRSQKKYSGSLVSANADAFYMFFKKHFGPGHAMISRFILLMQGLFRLIVSLIFFPLALLLPKVNFRGAFVPRRHLYLMKWAVFGRLSLLL